MKLNEEQTLAATHPLGEAALLLAGAGSGKTATLTERIAWLIEQGIPSRRILALTFTNKAAGEIRERVLKRTGLTEELAPRLTTIHSLALSFIRKNPAGFGLDAKVSPLADYDQIELLKKIIERMGDNAPESNAFLIRDKIAYHRARGTAFAVDYNEEVHKNALRHHSGYHAMIPIEIEVWKLFEQEKVANSTIDFDDMLAFVNRRMRQDPDWAAKVQSLFLHIMMDEAQDTNVPAWDFVNHLVSPQHRNLFVVGDVSQSIYGFTGAAPYLIIQFTEEWRGSAPTLYKLQRNHRSTPEIVKLANSIQNKMTETLPLKMESFRGLQGETGATRIMRCSDQAPMPRDLAARIAQEITSSGRPYKDFAILIRAGSQLMDLEGALIQSRIPYVVRGGKGLLQTEEVRDVLSYIRLATNPKDFSAFVRASSAPKRGMGDVALEAVRKKANAEFGGDLIKAAFATGGKTTTFGDTLKVVQQFLSNPVDAIDKCLSFTDYPGHLRKKYAKEPDRIESKLENLRRLRDMIFGLTGEGGMSVEDMIFQLTMDRSEIKDERGQVTISTIHAAKGLEWPVVIIFNVVEGVLPSKFCTTPGDVEEERRLWYVAVTRARDICYITLAKKIQIGKNYGFADPSRFLGELGIG